MFVCVKSQRTGVGAIRSCLIEITVRNTKRLRVVDPPVAMEIV
jgi:hypothetical protein